MIVMASLAMAAITWSVWFILYRQVLSPELVALICLLTPLLASTRFCGNLTGWAIRKLDMLQNAFCAMACRLPSC